MKINVWGTVLTLILAGAVWAHAETVDVLVVYNGPTRTNRFAVKDIARWVRDRNEDIRLTFVDEVPSRRQSGGYDVVVVLSTGSPDGVEAAHHAYLTGEDRGDTHHVLVALIAGGDRVFVDDGAVLSARYGVDAVSSATLWPRNVLRAFIDETVRERNDSIRAMHQEWVDRLVAMIEEATR